MINTEKLSWKNRLCLFQSSIERQTGSIQPEPWHKKIAVKAWCTSNSRSACWHIVIKIIIKLQIKIFSRSKHKRKVYSWSEAWIKVKSERLSFAPTIEEERMGNEPSKSRRKKVIKSVVLLMWCIFWIFTSVRLSSSHFHFYSGFFRYRQTSQSDSNVFLAVHFYVSHHNEWNEYATLPHNLLIWQICDQQGSVFTSPSHPPSIHSRFSMKYGNSDTLSAWSRSGCRVPKTYYFNAVNY